MDKTSPAENGSGGITVYKDLICFDDSDQLHVGPAVESRKETEGMIVDEADDRDADGRSGLGRQMKSGEDEQNGCNDFFHVQ